MVPWKIKNGAARKFLVGLSPTLLGVQQSSPALIVQHVFSSTKKCPEKSALSLNDTTVAISYNDMNKLNHTVLEGNALRNT